MNRQVVVAPVRKAITVNADPLYAFEVFTSRIDRWWPKTYSIGTSPPKALVIEPFVGGRWYTRCEDGTDIATGRVLVWDPPRRFVSSWELNAEWQPDPTVASEVEVRFVAAGEGTTIVELEHRNFERLGQKDGQSMRDQVDGGWPKLLDLFKACADVRDNVEQRGAR